MLTLLPLCCVFKELRCTVVRPSKDSSPQEKLVAHTRERCANYP